MSRSDNGARFEVVIGRGKDGSSPSCALIDEYHEHQTDSLVDAMITGMGAREQPILLIVTTAGSNLAGPCREFQTELEKMLDGVTEVDDLFGVIWTCDPDIDWTSDRALRQANPNYDISVSGEFLRAQQADAIRDARKQNIFRTKHLNQWVNASTAWMNMVQWHAQADAPAIEEMEGQPCYAGVDLASKLDLTARVLVFKRQVNGQDHYYAYPTQYLPEERVSDPKAQTYQKWVTNGNLITTEGSMLDYTVFTRDTIEAARQYRIEQIAYDPFQGPQFAQTLAAEVSGTQMVEVPMKVQFLSEPMKFLEGLIADRRFHHTGCPVLMWCISNVVCRQDANGNVFPRTPSDDRLKIDSAVALILALSRAIVTPTSAKKSANDIYESRGFRFL